MDNNSNKVFGDLELTATIAAVVVLLLFGAAFVNGNDGRRIFSVLLVMGALLNGILSWISHLKKKKIRAILLGVLAVFYLLIGVLVFCSMRGA